MKLNIKIPTSLNEITLRQYKRFLSVQKQTEESLLLNAKMIEIFCSVDLPNVMRLKVSDIDEITEKITNLFETKPQIVKKFKINKIEYGFHTNLDELSLGEYIDLDMHIGDWDNMEKAMNVLYRPILVSLKDKYSIEEYTVNDSDKVLDMPMDAVLSSVFFLWNLGLELSQVMTNYLESQEENPALTAFLNSQQNTDGISHSFQGSLKGILDDLKISLN